MDRTGDNMRSSGWTHVRPWGSEPSGYMGEEQGTDQVTYGSYSDTYAEDENTQNTGAAIEQVYEEDRRPRERRLLPTWGQDEDRHLLELARQGTNWADIALQLPGRTSQDCLHRYSLLLPNSTSWSKNALIKDGTSWSPEDEAQLLTLWQDGRTTRVEMALILQRTVLACQQHYLKYMEVAWSPEESTLLKQLKAERKSWDEIMEYYPSRTKESGKRQWRKMKKNTNIHLEIHDES
jgi:hypothetical protein